MIGLSKHEEQLSVLVIRRSQMAVENIDLARCNGCGICVKTCPMDVFRLDMDSKRAVIKYPEDCMLCGGCLMDCPHEAVSVTLDKKSPLLVSWG